MTRNSIVRVILASLSVLGAAGAAWPQDVGPSNAAITNGAITTINYPGAAGTAALDINAAGFIVGRYMSAGHTHGFLRSPEGVFTTIDYPGASLTVAAAINDHGDIAGQYAVSTAPAQRHGFLLTDGQFTSFDPPGSVFTNALGIDERGEIVGRYCTVTPCLPAGEESFHGFLLYQGQLTDIDVPDAIETDPWKINGRGQIAGGFLSVDHTEQIFVLTNGTFTSFAPPSGQPVSLDTGGINERGDIVGAYCDSALPCLMVPSGTHGFLISGGDFTTIDVPGAIGTAAFGINARGDIVGQYADSTGNHGFLLSQWVYEASDPNE